MEGLDTDSAAGPGESVRLISSWTMEMSELVRSISSWTIEISDSEGSSSLLVGKVLAVLITSRLPCLLTR